MPNAKLIVQVAYDATELTGHFSEKFLTDEGSDDPMNAILEISILQATGLQDAVCELLITHPAFAPYLHGGINSFVRFSLFPTNKELELLYAPFITPCKAQSFSPVYGWRNTLVLLLNAIIYKELRTSWMSFEVFQLSTSKVSINRDIWLATAAAPCESLLSDTGVKGWLNLLSRKGNVVGALEVAIKFKHFPFGKPLHLAAESSMP